MSASRFICLSFNMLRRIWSGGVSRQLHAGPMLLRPAGSDLSHSILKTSLLDICDPGSDVKERCQVPENNDE